MQPNKPHLLLDTLTQRLQLKNDAALSRALEVAPPVISKIRHRVISFGDSILLRTHDITGIEVRDLLKLRAESDEKVPS